jgi:hypothetical protein
MAGEMMMSRRSKAFKMRNRVYGIGCYSPPMATSTAATKPVMKIDEYVLDVLMPDLIGHDRQPSAFVVYLRLWRLTSGGKKKSAPLSLRDLSDQTGLSKRAIQDAVDRLERRQLVTVERAMPTAVPMYKVLRPWVR